MAYIQKNPPKKPVAHYVTGKVIRELKGKGDETFRGKVNIRVMLTPLC
jgi:hypothetical protein